MLSQKHQPSPLQRRRERFNRTPDSHAFARETAGVQLSPHSDFHNFLLHLRNDSQPPTPTLSHERLREPLEIIPLPATT